VTEGPLQRVARGALTENLGLKGIALVAAVFLFAAIRGGEDAEREIDVEVVTLVPSENSERVLVADVPESVELVVFGPRSLLSGLRDDDVAPVQADLRTTRARSFEFEEALFDLPAGMRIRSIMPASFPIAWEPRKQRRVRILATIRGEPIPGQGLKAEPEIEPAQVTLVGAQSAAEEVDTAATEIIDLAGLGAGRHSRTVRLKRPPRHSWWEGDPEVTVRFEIGPDLVERTFRDLPVRVVGSAWTMNVHPRLVDVVLRGPRETISQVDSEHLLPFVEGRGLEEAGPGNHRIPPRIEDLPAAVDVVRWQPGHVLVDVRRPR